MLCTRRALQCAHGAGAASINQPCDILPQYETRTRTQETCKAWPGPQKSLYAGWSFAPPPCKRTFTGYLTALWPPHAIYMHPRYHVRLHKACKTRRPLFFSQPCPSSPSFAFRHADGQVVAKCAGVPPVAWFCDRRRLLQRLAAHCRYACNANQPRRAVVQDADMRICGCRCAARLPLGPRRCWVPELNLAPVPTVFVADQPTGGSIMRATPLPHRLGRAERGEDASDAVMHALLASLLESR